MKTLDLNQMEIIKGGNGCAWAVAGMVAATIGFAFVTGGASLIFAFAAKGIAFGGMMSSCS